MPFIWQCAPTVIPARPIPTRTRFDFWIGEWDVFVGGQLVGSNSIKPILNHCALSEEWASAGGGFGRSYNYYDTGTRTWNQVWISDSGSFVEFEGEARDGGMFYTAETINPADGSVTQHKFLFHRVRQRRCPPGLGAIHRRRQDLDQRVGQPLCSQDQISKSDPFS